MIVFKHLVIWAVGLFALGETGLHAPHSLGIAVWLLGGLVTAAYAQYRLEQRRIAAHAHRVYQDEQIREQVNRTSFKAKLDD